jgi:hypothetical protein
MFDTVTPLEEAVLNAYEFGASLAAAHVICELINTNDALTREKNRTPLSGQTLARRKEILVEMRRNNQALSVVAQLNEMTAGISA